MRSTLGESEAVEVYTKLLPGEDFRVEHHSLPNCHSNKTSHMNKLLDPSSLDCHGEPNLLSSSVIQNTVPSTSTDSLLAQGCEKVVPLQIASASMDFKDVEGSQYHSSRQSKIFDDPIRRVGLGNPLSELSSHHSGLINNLSLELPARAGYRMGCDVEKSSHSSDEYENSKVNVVNEKEIVTRCQKKEVETNSDDNLPEDSLKPPKQGLEEEKVSNVPATVNAKETSSQSHHADDSDESDFVEHDVKVCDICGDAGREDLLAICCRCIDGAEHTYCMKEMIDEIPEGDWLCEECKLDEENKNTTRQKNGTETGAEKDQFSGQADTEPASTFIKPDTKGSSVEEPRTGKDHSVMKASSKRRAEESDSSSAVKKQALEMITGSPRTSSPSKLHALTDSSTKDVDRGKIKSSHQFSSDSLFGNEAPEAARSPATRPRLQSLRGSFTKSNSFNIPNARSKTKLVDEIVLQRQKSTKERASHDTVVAREMGKSVSFRSTNLGRLGASGSKVKMLSPKSSRVQDLKGLKTKKERIFERNNSVKLPSVGNLSTSSSAALSPKVDKLLVSRGEATPVSSACNSEVKPLKGDNKMMAGLKSTNRSVTGAEVPVSLVNKQLPSSPPGVGTATSSGIISSIEQKSVVLKDDNSSKLAISRESSSLADGIKETTTPSHLGPGLIPGMPAVSGLNHKHVANSAQLHTADRPAPLGLNASATRSSKEVKNRDNKLKAAIEAALLKKPGIYRKNKVSDQSDEPSVSSMNNEVAFVDRVPHSRNAGNLTSAEVLTDRQGQVSRSSNPDHCKHSNGKHFTSELSSYDAVALSSLSKVPAIPDHEYIWQYGFFLGSFEISRSGKTAEFWDGLQAHLSTSASPRVFEAVNNLPHKILLNGVSRISAWPAQFENNGAKEDNIALYFFAKDVESYEKSYQVLLDDMIRGDLALIGSINGVELLIFPSNQLPEKSHRWNMLFFLWGVLRGKKKNSLHQVPDDPEKNCIPQVASSISTDKMSSVEDVCSLGSIDKEHVDSESMGNLKLPTSSLERAIDIVNVVPVSSGEIVSLKPVTDGNISVVTKNDSQDTVNRSPEIDQKPILTEVPTEELNRLQVEPRKRAFVDLTEDDDTNPINMWHDANVSKKQKRDDLYGQISLNIDCGTKENSNGERYFFPVDPRCEVKDSGSLIPFIGPSFPVRVRTPNLNLALGAEMDDEEIPSSSSGLVGGSEQRLMTKKEEEEDVLSSLSLSLSFSGGNKDEEDKRNSSSMLLFRDK
ncbi:uncharacterized protein LOC112509282 isoform X2 [Cynara cardunculus var. scolymus]|uniref:uncharacterized protein LOC112509282 isoform X2 n=1 Tax=Cynara cardunculus var. scolymus TaxID=59895 RepID=UPI000D624B0D|nr:uncharacterized protein LOC112509282 isoform X2 [Cynara cardunculus var. scolymus]